MILTARIVFPVTGPPLPNGTVTVHGDRISSVDPACVRTPDLDLGNAALIPGLVNAHTHLDLSGARGRIPPTDPDHFTDWLLGVIAYRRTRTPDEVQADIRTGLAEALSFGTTLLGDIAAGGASWEAVSGATVRAVVFHELIGLAPDRVEDVDNAMDEWVSARQGHPLCRPALSPHAPYSTNQYMIRMACHKNVPVTIHWMESRAEVELIERRDGPFVGFLRRLTVWEEDDLIPRFKPALANASFHAPLLLLAHANHQPTDVYFRPNTTVVYCPRTHAAFGHPPHPFRDFLARGVRVCLGTDSLASNPDLDPLAEARFVRSRHPDFPADQLLRMVTLSGAESLGWADECGSLAPGKSADLVAVPLPNIDAADPHDLLLGEAAVAGPRRTLFRGAWRA